MAFRVNKSDVETFLRAHAHIEDPHLFDVGQTIGEWRITAFIGKGGCGEVYRVKHALLDFVAAIKILTREDQASKDRFRREAQVFAENDLPTFPRFYGYGRFNGRPYMVIELLEHLLLPTTDAGVAKYLKAVCSGVGRLHALGLVHRDIKPQNILQRGATGQPVLIDLGFVKDVNLSVVHQGESLSIVNGKAVGVGTPRFAAPEQFSGGAISPAADVHALGMLANECFGGNPPRSWARIIRRSTSSIPSQRYKTVEEFADAVRKRHKVNVLVVVTALALLVALATAARIGWLSAASRQAHVAAVSRHVSEGEDRLIDEAVATPRRRGVPPRQNKEDVHLFQTRRAAASTVVGAFAATSPPNSQ